MEIFDIVVEEITKAGLMILMNNHISSSMWCCSTSDGEGLWWTHKYPEHMWIDCMKHFAKRYANNKRVMGVDLRN
jgi:endoglucanase